jgi:hypothetical protein
VICSFGLGDKFQAISHDKQRIPAGGRAKLMLPDTVAHVQVYRLGIGGLTSSRTRLTSGYGFEIEEFAEYDLNNRGVNEVVTMTTAAGQSVENKKYVFGDMTKAALGQLKNVNAKAVAMFKVLKEEILFEANEYQRFVDGQQQRSEEGGSSENEHGASSTTIFRGTHEVSSYDSSSMVLEAPPEANLWALFFAAVSSCGYACFHLLLLILFSFIHIRGIVAAYTYLPCMTVQHLGAQ